MTSTTTTASTTTSLVKQFSMDEYVSSFDNSIAYLSLNKNNRNLKLFIEYFTTALLKASQTNSKKLFYIVKHLPQNEEVLNMFVVNHRLILEPFFNADIMKKELIIRYNRKRLYIEGEEKVEDEELKLENVRVFLNVELTEKVFEFVKKYNEEELSESFTENANIKKYSGSISFEDYNLRVKDGVKVHELIGVPEDSVEEFRADYIIPDHMYNFRNFIKNMQDNKNLKHLFNHSHPLQHNFMPEERLQRTKIRVNSFLSEVNLDIEYASQCTECNLVNRFNRFEMAGTIRCSGCDAIVKTNNAVLTIPKQITLKEYDIAFWNPDTSDWQDSNIGCFSMVDLRSGTEEVELILLNSVNDKRIMGDSSLLIIARNTKLNNIELDHPIIDMSYLPKKKSVIEHFYDCILKYFQEEHHLYVTTQHKLPNMLCVFSTLANYFHSVKMLIVVAGYSGSGKSFLIDNIIPLLHTRYAVVSGPRVSKNKYVGGEPDLVNAFSKTRFAKGVVGTNTMVCVEEFTDVVERFLTDTNGKAQNILSMEKEMNDKKVKITTKGTKEYPVTASRYYVGNLDDMTAMSVYKDILRREYRKISKGKRLDPGLPLYKSIEWYAKNCSKELAQAHYNIRSGNTITPMPKNMNVNWDFGHNHYVFHLPSAEMARFHYAFYLEQVMGENLSGLEAPQDSMLLNKEVDTTKLHVEQLLREWKEIFTKVNIQRLNAEEIEKYGVFFKSIENYIKHEYLAPSRRNNLRFAGENLNTHVVDRLLLRAKSFFLFEKQARKEPLELTERDKQLFEDIELYNYNGLSVLEAAMEKKPFVNDAYTFDEETTAQGNIAWEEEDEQKKREDEEELSKLIQTQHSETVFDEVEKDEL